jgi:hypothetical protein
MLDRSSNVKSFLQVDRLFCLQFCTGYARISQKEDASMEEPDESKAKGGYARAEALSPKERQDIARKAAQARWSSDIPVASHEGDFRVGEANITAAVLPGGQRLLTQATFLRALGRSRSPKAGTGVLSTVDGLPFFLQAEVLKPFISEELVKSTAPIFFRTTKGKKAVGYDAELLPRVCEVYLRFRDQYAAQGETVPNQYKHIIYACDVLMRGLAHVGIVALVDEATGYQEVRDRLALQAILDAYLRKELAAWARCFPDEFYQEIFRLRGWTWRGMKINRPQVVAKYTNNIVYERLAPGILEELQTRNPIQNGRRRVKHHQWLTEDVGHPALAQHLYAVIALMKVSSSWSGFLRMLDKAFVRRGENFYLPGVDDNTMSTT